MKFCLIYLTAVFAYVAGQGIPSATIANNFIKMGATNNVGVVASSWSQNNKWNTGSFWNITSVWEQNTTGITYKFLSQPSKWFSWEGNSSLTFADVDSCSTWRSYKATFSKDYKNNETDEVQR